MENLRRIHAQAIPAALERATRYRLLNEPREAESICRDILEVDPHHQGALTTLLLALTDQFSRADLRECLAQAEGIVPLLAAAYDREYYAGVVTERAGKALLASGHSIEGALARIREAMGHFDRAEGLAESGNDEALLRWNACVRLVRRYGADAQAHASRGFDPESFDDEVPR